jgi:transcriptional regulator with XRE-family HTH domain
MADLSAQDAEDWDAVGRAIAARLTDTRKTQMDVASRAQVSLTTLRELQHNLNPRRRRPQTLTAISEALGWPPGYLDQVLRGHAPQPHADEASDPILHVIDDLEQEIQALRTRVEEIERQLADEDVQP